MIPRSGVNLVVRSITQAVTVRVWIEPVRPSDEAGGHGAGDGLVRRHERAAIRHGSSAAILVATIAGKQGARHPVRHGPQADSRVARAMRSLAPVREAVAVGILLVVGDLAVLVVVGTTRTGRSRAVLVAVAVREGLTRGRWQHAAAV